MHSNLNYNSTMRHKCNDRVFPNKALETFNANSRIFCCDFSSDGSVLCLADQEHIITLINTENDDANNAWKVYKQVEASFEGWSIIDVALAPDHQFAAYSGWSENVCIVNTHGSHELHESYPMEPIAENSWGRCCAFGICFDPDSSKIVAGWSAGSLTFHDLEMKENEFRLTKAHSDDINTVCMCDRNLIVTGSDDAFVKVLCFFCNFFFFCDCLQSAFFCVCFLLAWFFCFVFCAIDCFVCLQSCFLFCFIDSLVCNLIVFLTCFLFCFVFNMFVCVFESIKAVFCFVWVV